MVQYHIYDVVVVGAGLSGLQAAVTVQEAGLSCLVLEATDRIGGKVLSIPNTSGSKVTVDMGAAWINDTSQSRMFALGQKFGAQFQQQFEEGDLLFETEDGKAIRRARDELPGTPEEAEVLLKLVAQIDELGKQVKAEDFSGPLSRKLDKLTFREWIERESDNLQNALLFLNFLTQALVGAETNDVSALYMLRYIEAGQGFQSISGVGKNTGQHIRPYQGSQIYVNGLASMLQPNTILTSHPVLAITQHGTYCSLTTPTSTFASQKVIVSIPTPLYRDIAFHPPLPQHKHTLSTSTKMGYYTKVVASYTSRWWRPLSGEMQSISSDPRNPITLIFDTSIPDQSQFSLSLFILSAPGRTWSLLPTAKRHKLALDHLHRLFGPFVGGDHTIPSPISLHEQDWSKEMWFKGAPSSLYGVGLLSSEAGRSMREPVGDVHFVGTEMSEVWEGYMEGAVRDGERGGLEAVEALKTSAAR